MFCLFKNSCDVFVLVLGKVFMNWIFVMLNFNLSLVIIYGFGLFNFMKNCVILLGKL